MDQQDARYKTASSGGANGLAAGMSRLSMWERPEDRQGSRPAYNPPHRRQQGDSSAYGQDSGYSRNSAQTRGPNFPTAFGGERRMQGREGTTGYSAGMGASAPEDSGVPGQFEWLPRNKALEGTLFGGSTHKTGINFEKYEDIPVSVSGPDAPAAIADFETSTLHDLVKDNVRLAAYSNPTPVQKNAVAIVAGGRDLMACAQTGSGKTAAFLLPIISQLLKHAAPPGRGHSSYMRNLTPQALIMAPTRELAMQIFEEARKFTYRSWVRPGVAYGGQPMGQQLAEMRGGVDLLVATPGRLSDMFSRGKLSLARVRFLVLDEADRMLDMGFEPQIRQIVDGADMCPKDSRQTLMFSATFPRDIQLLAADFLRPDYVFLSVGRVGSTSENIQQEVLWVEDPDKRHHLMEILRAGNSGGAASGLTLIFCETKRGVDALDDFLYNNRFRTTSIHGDRTQQQREDALRAFRTGETNIMVATAVAARGLDIPNVTHVVNYDLPGDVDDYVHRIGRTGRAGNVGRATSFFNSNNRGIGRGIYDLLKEANQPIPDWLRDVGRPAGVPSFGQSGYRPGRSTGGPGGSGAFGGRGGPATSGSRFGGSFDARTPSPASSYGRGYAQSNASSSYSSGGWGAASQDDGRYGSSNSGHVADSWDN